MLLLSYNKHNTLQKIVKRRKETMNENESGKTINVKKVSEKKKKFRMLETDERELEEKLREHRRKNLRRTLIIAGILAVHFF